MENLNFSDYAPKPTASFNVPALSVHLPASIVRVRWVLFVLGLMLLVLMGIAIAYSVIARKRARTMKGYCGTDAECLKDGDKANITATIAMILVISGAATACILIAVGEGVTFSKKL